MEYLVNDEDAHTRHWWARSHCGSVTLEEKQLQKILNKKSNFFATLTAFYNDKAPLKNILTKILTYHKNYGIIYER